MGVFFVYILRSSLFVIAYYLFYRLLLSRDTFHRFNRWALLTILMLSVVLPFMQFSIGGTEANAASDISIEGAVATVLTDAETKTSGGASLL